MSNYELPPTAQAIEKAVGFGGLCRMVDAHAGAKVYIPRQLGEEHPLAQLLGGDLAAALAEQLGGQSITVPKIVGVLRARRDQEIWERYQAGESACELARDYGLIWRSVQKIVRRVNLAGGTPAQARVEEGAAQLSFAWQGRDL
jgi:hypothetical protein